MRARIFAVLPMLCSAAAPADAHHSLAPYNTSIYLTVYGTVKSFTWSNPHVQLVVMVLSPEGIVKEWRFDGANIGRLASNGFSRTMIAPGDRIKIQYNPKRGGGTGGFFIGITTADGKNRNIQRLNGD